MQSLLSSNINVWMLSGDRQENAVSIAKSSRLLRDETPMILLPDCPLDESREIILEHLDKISGQKLDGMTNELALVVSGRTIGQCSECPRIYKVKILEIFEIWMHMLMTYNLIGCVKVMSMLPTSNLL